MPELSSELQQEIVRELGGDLARFSERLQWLQQSNMQRPDVTLYQQVEHLVYITEQMRLKLRMLGGPRIGGY